MLNTLNKFKLLSIITLVIFNIFLLQNSANSQDNWDEIVWEKYNLKFKLPSYLQETHNDSEKYIAESKSLVFEIYPWKDSNATEEEVALEALGSLDIDEVVVTSSEKRDLNGFQGYEIWGEGTIDGKDVNFTVLGFIDPDSSINFAAYVLYWQGVLNGELFNIGVERDIIESIKKY